jgi:hypothetical protein
VGGQFFIHNDEHTFHGSELRENVEKVIRRRAQG